MLGLMALVSSVYGLTDGQQLRMPFVRWLGYLSQVRAIEARQTLGMVTAARLPLLKQYDQSRALRQLSEAAYGKAQRTAPSRSPMTAAQVNAVVAQMAGRGRKGKVTFVREGKTNDKES